MEEASESNSDDDGDGGDDGSAVLRVKRKTEGERREEESEYVRWLKGEGGRVTAHEAEDIGTLQKYWTDPQLGEDEAFLRDFILNKGYMDKDVARCVGRFESALCLEVVRTQDIFFVFLLASFCAFPFPCSQDSKLRRGGSGIGPA